MISTNDYFVGSILTHHLKATYLFLVLVVNSKKFILIPQNINLHKKLTFYSYLILLQLKILI